jgi:hypothetical protein
MECRFRVTLKKRIQKMKNNNKACSKKKNNKIKIKIKMRKESLQMSKNRHKLLWNISLFKIHLKIKTINKIRRSKNLK